MNDQKTKLAVRVVGDHFGDVVKNIAKVLTEGDNCTVPYIFRSVNANLAAQNNNGPAMLASGGSKISALDSATVRQALMILHQHNCLQVDIPKVSEYDTSTVQPKNIQTGFLYSLNINNIVHRLQFARLLSIVRNKFGELSVLVMEAVILYGKVRLDQIQDIVAQVQELDTKKEGPAFTPYEVKSAFESLVSNRFLVTVPFLNASKSLSSAVEMTAEDSKKSSTKRTFDIMAGLVPNTGAATSSKRGPGVSKPATATSNRRGAAGSAKLLLKEETDDGIPVELRMMMGIEPAAASSSGGTTKKGVVGADSALNTAVRSTKGAPDAEWDDELPAGAAAGRGGRGGAGRGGGRGGRGAAGGRLVGAGRGTAASAASAAAASAAKEAAGLIEAEAAELDSTSNSSASSSEGPGVAVPLWMVGWDQFLRETRHEVCTQVVTQLHESMAGSVVRIMLALSMGTEMGSNQNKSGEVSVADIFAQLEREYHAENAPSGNKNSFGGVNAAGALKKKAVRLDLISLKRLLEYLRLSESGAVIKVVGSETELGGPSYMVNIDGLINTLQRRTVFSVASERFGFVSARIVELLQRHRFLEQQQVCDMALLPARETRERLYKLFLDKWVNYIDLSKRNDFNPSTSHYFWYLDLPLLKATIRDHVYQTIYNLTLRRAHESDLGRELLDREHLIDNEADRNRHAQLMNRLNKLDLALQRVSTTALLMEYC